MSWHFFNRRNEAPCDYECGSSNYQFLIPSRTFSPLPTSSLHKNDLPQRHPSTPYYAEPCHPSNKVPPLPPIPGLENLFSILSSSPSPDSARPFRWDYDKNQPLATSSGCSNTYSWVQDIMPPPPLLLPHTRVGDVFKPVLLQQWFPSISPS